MGKDGCPWRSDRKTCRLDPFEHSWRSGPKIHFDKGFKSCKVADGQECPTRERRRGRDCMFSGDRRCDEGCVGWLPAEPRCKSLLPGEAVHEDLAGRGVVLVDSLKR